MNYHDRHVVVTGGTGALGSAVVSMLVGAGAVCHIPYIDPPKPIDLRCAIMPVSSS